MRYRPISFHARGGLGEVLIAQDLELNRSVALKRILGDRARDPEAHRRFVLEAEITGRLEHPGVVPIYGCGVDPSTGQPFYAMRFITGQSLKAVLDDFHAGGGDFESLSFRKLLQNFISVCQTLEYAHARGVIHRDLKPANVMVGSFGETLVVDWGLAKVLADSVVGEPGSATPRHAAGALSGRLTPSLPASHPIGTGRGALGSSASQRGLPPVGLAGSRGSPGTATVEGAGSPGYMSPEQAAGEVERLGPASDIYGLGATLYHILTGRAPLGDQSTVAAVSLTMMGQVPTPRSLLARIPLPLEAVCRKAMAADVRRRYASAAELAADVERWLADEPLAGQRETLPQRAQRWARRHPTTLAAGVAGLLVAGFAAVVGVGLLNAQKQQLRDSLEREAAARASAEAAVRDAELARKTAEDARAAEHTAREQADALRTRAEANFALARKAVSDCLDLARSHPTFAKPGHQEARLLLLQTAEPYHEQFVRGLAGGAASARTAGSVKREHVLARFERALQQAEVQSIPEATATYRKLIPDLEQLVAESPGDARLRRELAIAHGNLGGLLDRLGNLNDALREQRLSVQQLAELAEQYPNELGYASDLSIGRSNLGAVLHNLGDFPSARAQFAESIKLRERLIAAEPDNGSHRNELAVTQYNLGRLLRIVGDREGAERAHRAALEIRLRLAALNPKAVELARGLARSHTAVGSLLKDRGDLAGARDQAAAALKLQQRLLEENPSVLDLQAELALTHNSLGVLARLQRDNATAETHYRAALKLRLELATRHPKVENYRQDLASSYFNLGNLLREKQELAASEQSYREAIRLQETLTTTGAPSSDRIIGELLTYRYSLGALLCSHHRFDEAIKEGRAILPMAEKLPSGLVIQGVPPPTPAQVRRLIEVAEAGARGDPAPPAPQVQP